MRIGQEELKNVLQNFRWIDDIPEDQNKRDEICVEARAALLLEANIDSEMMPAFIRGERDERISKPHHYKLASPITFDVEEDDPSCGKRTRSVAVRYFEYGCLNESKKFWGPARISDASSNGWSVYLHDGGFTWRDGISTFSELGKTIRQNFYLNYPSFYSVCKGITPYKKPSQMCRFWGSSGEPFAKIKVRNMRPDYIWGNASLGRTPEQANWTDARMEQYAFRYLIPCQSPLLPNIRLENRCFENWYSQIFPFRNEYGEEIMKLIKVYDPETQSKCLLPVTTWIRNNSSNSQLFCVPYPADKTPLYNLDLLLNPECQTVILCDSVELADANQRENGSEEVVFTSFICSPGRFEQVDWTPLQEKDLLMLVSEHSGISLESAALKAKELRDYLCEEQEFEPALAVVPVDYSKRRHRDFNSVDDLLKRFQDAPPTVNQEDLKILETASEIDEFFQKAEAELNKLPDKWWLSPEVPPEEKRIVEKQKQKPKPIDFVLQPLLVRGEATMLYARKGVGKSAIAYSIAARVVAQGFSAKPVPLMPGQWWTVPKGRYKVLYLDFENMGEMESKKKAFQEGYFPAGKEQECRANLLMKDLSQVGIDFSAPENHQKLFDMLEAAKKEGIPDKPVDLLVIDTYTAFVHTETPATPANFKDLVNKIRKMGIAVLIVHHANAENEARGLSSKLDALFLTVNLSCETGKTEGDLDEQNRIVKYEDPRGPMASETRKPFEILFDKESKRWKVKGTPRSENAELALIVEAYKKHEYGRDAICQMLGLEKTALSDRLKRAKEIK